MEKDLRKKRSGIKDFLKSLINNNKTKEMSLANDNKYKFEQEEKVYFTPGEVVTIKQDIPNKPIMLVKNKEQSMIKGTNGTESNFKGIKCFWFSTDGYLQEATFNTKDLIKIEPSREKH